jgi:hypothetical protein
MAAQPALDTSRPYAEVHGLPGAKYEQDGTMFNGEGKPVNEKDVKPYVDEPPPPKDDAPLPYCTLEEQTSTEARPANMDGMSNSHLKALVETFGGTWTNRHDAMAYLKGKK